MGTEVDSVVVEIVEVEVTVVVVATRAARPLGRSEVTGRREEAIQVQRKKV